MFDETKISGRGSAGLAKLRHELRSYDKIEVYASGDAEECSEVLKMLEIMYGPVMPPETGFAQIDILDETNGTVHSVVHLLFHKEREEHRSFIIWFLSMVMILGGMLDNED